MAEKGIRTMKGELFDSSAAGRRKKRSVKTHIRHSDAFLEVSVEGYGEQGATEGHGSPVVLEFYEGKLRCLVFDNINSEEPSHVIDLEGAHESKRIKDDAADK